MLPAFVALPAGPVSVGARAWRYRGKTHITAIVKAAFRIVQDRPMELVNPVPLIEGDVQRSQSPLSSLRRASDLALFLRQPEVTLDALAFSPPGARGATTESEQVKVRLAVARGTTMLLSKELRVLGDRTVMPNEAPGRPLPFSRMPIVYERALGGSGTLENPAGVGAVTEGGGRVTMPNIVLGEGARSEPAGFGPISSAWAARHARRGPLSVSDANTAPYVDLPEGFDRAYFQSAPMDQWLEDVRPGDLFAFVGLHPDMPTLRTSIPSLRGVAQVETKRGNRAPVRLKLDSLFFEPHALKAELTFRGALEILPEDLDGIMIAGAIDDPAQPFTFPDLKALAAMTNRLGAASTANAERTVAFSSQQRARESTMILEPEPAPAAAKPREPAVGFSGTMVIDAPAELPKAPPVALPRVAQARTVPIPPSFEPQATPERSERRVDRTMEISIDEAPQSMPFNRQPKRSRSSSRGVAQPSSAGTPWANAAAAPAPVVASAGNATMVVDMEPPPAREPAPAPPSQRGGRTRKSSSAMPAVTPKAEEAKKVPFSWGANASSEPVAAKPAPAPARPVVQPAPDRKAELYKKFKR